MESMEKIFIMAGNYGLTHALSLIMVFIGACAFITAVIVEGLKSIDRIDRLPTKLVCYVVALAVTTPSFAALAAWMSHPVEWYMVFASFLASFVVAKVSMSGWDEVAGIAGRLLPK